MHRAEQNTELLWEIRTDYSPRFELVECERPTCPNSNYTLLRLGCRDRPSRLQSITTNTKSKRIVCGPASPF